MLEAISGHYKKISRYNKYCNTRHLPSTTDKYQLLITFHYYIIDKNYKEHVAKLPIYVAKLLLRYNNIIITNILGKLMGVALCGPFATFTYLSYSFLIYILYGRTEIHTSTLFKDITRLLA